jgi:hypothetical protein
MKQWCSHRAVLGYLFSFYCSICNILLVSHKGSYALLQNARTAEHKKNVTIKIMPNQLHLSAASSMESSKPAKLPMHLGAYVVWDETTVAEITWALKMIESEYSGKSADRILDVYNVFHDAVIKNFFFEQTKFA